MKFFRLFPALLIALALFAAGCGESKEEKQIKELSASQKELTAQVGRELTEVLSAASDLKAANDSTRQALRDADEKMVIANQKIADLQKRVQTLQTQLNQKSQQLKEQEARAAEASKPGIFRIILVIAVILLILYIIVRLMRSRSEFEDEDDDFADFEDDEDLGFDDDENLEEDKKDDDDKK